MKENWMNDNLCSFDEKTRIELGPQLIELECTDANLEDTVTSPWYRIGRIDALGRVIMPERISGVVLVRGAGSIAEGEMMTVVDWREKHKPKAWKIYQMQDTGEVYKKDARKDEAGEHKAGDPVTRFIKVGEDENKDDALDFARTLAGEM